MNLSKKKKKKKRIASEQNRWDHNLPSPLHPTVKSLMKLPSIAQSTIGFNAFTTKMCKEGKMGLFASSLFSFMNNPLQSHWLILKLNCPICKLPQVLSFWFYIQVPVHCYYFLYCFTYFFLFFFKHSYACLTTHKYIFPCMKLRNTYSSVAVPRFL